jgi:hypothetical protein
MKLDVEVDFEEGDILIINDEAWKIKEIDEHTADIIWKSTSLGNIGSTSREEIEERIKYSGKFVRIREEYIDVFQA